MIVSAYLGIDPGLSGGLALYDPAEATLETAEMPTLRIGTKRKIDVHALARIIDNWADRTREAWIEQVGVRPGEGAVGAFSFGRGYGQIEGVCCASFLSMQTVTPQMWKRSLRITGDKDEARAKASSLFPRHAHLWALKRQDGVAEAALIALYGARQAQAVAA